MHRSQDTGVRFTSETLMRRTSFLLFICGLLSLLTVPTTGVSWRGTAVNAVSTIPSHACEPILTPPYNRHGAVENLGIRVLRRASIEGNAGRMSSGFTASQQEKRAELKIDPKRFDDFIGQYSFVDNPDLVLSFWREGDKFFVQPTNQPKLEMFAESESKFFVRDPNVQAMFVRDAQGKVTWLVWRQDNQDHQLKRIS